MCRTVDVLYFFIMAILYTAAGILGGIGSWALTVLASGLSLMYGIDTGQAMGRRLHIRVDVPGQQQDPAGGSGEQQV